MYTQKKIVDLLTKTFHLIKQNNWLNHMHIIWLNQPNRGKTKHFLNEKKFFGWFAETLKRIKS